MTPWHLLVAVAGGLLLLWLALVATLYVAGRRSGEPAGLREALRLLPDVVRLLRRLASDPELPRGVRLRLAGAAVYLAFPLDLVPDFIPVAGYADDIIVVALLLRSVARRAGVDAIDRHWPGTPEGLRILKRVTGLAG
ncbi:uncharacterized membrane protein YkvA (DUF1232 family) [Marmoricola sp. URHA0025 HA25]